MFLARGGRPDLRGDGKAAVSVRINDDWYNWKGWVFDKEHLHALEHFVDEIQGTGPVVCDVDDAVMATRVAFAAIKSANEKRVVKMEEM